ncbi:MAG: hypothetical protein IPK09_06275 [Candidatus Competibacteraceae bacterium]|nr:hypothetical protein [Candidatus Competibacteraceae bacterium]
MHKLKTLGIVLLVALVLIAGGIWGYLWYSTKQQIEQIAALAKPFADISYGGITISPTGSIAVNRLRIILPALDDYLTIGSLRLSTPNLLELLKTQWQLSKGELPQALALSLQQFEIPLDGSLLGANQETLAQRSPFDDLEALGCGPVLSFGAAEWQELGYGKLSGDLTVGYRLDSARKLLELQFDSQNPTWAMVNVDVGLATSGPVSSLMALAASPAPKLSKLSVVIRDQGFNQRRNNYCAAKAGKTVDAYITEHIRLLEDRLRANDVYPGQGLLEAYRLYLADGGRLTLTASPAAPIEPTELQFYKPGDAIKLAGLTLAVNDQPVSDLSVNWDSTKIARALKAKPEIVPEPDRAEIRPAPPTAAAPVAIQKRTFRSVATAELNQHVGKMAKLTTANNARYTGKLNTISEDNVTITIFKPTGSATLSLRNKDIIEAQILY